MSKPLKICFRCRHQETWILLRYYCLQWIVAMPMSSEYVFISHRKSIGPSNVPCGRRLCHMSLAPAVSVGVSFNAGLRIPSPDTTILILLTYRHRLNKERLHSIWWLQSAWDGIYHTQAFSICTSRTSIKLTYNYSSFMVAHWIICTIQSVI